MYDAYGQLVADVLYGIYGLDTSPRRHLLPTGLRALRRSPVKMRALELVAGRDEIWLPRRWRGIELAGARQQRFIAALMKLIRLLERVSRPRLAVMFERRFSNRIFGLLVILGSLGAFLAPPFTGLDTLSALGVVLISLGMLLTDLLVVVVGLVVGLAGVALEIVVGGAAIKGIASLF